MGTLMLYVSITLNIRFTGATFSLEDFGLDTTIQDVKARIQDAKHIKIPIGNQQIHVGGKLLEDQAYLFLHTIENDITIHVLRRRLTNQRLIDRFIHTSLHCQTS